MLDLCLGSFTLQLNIANTELNIFWNLDMLTITDCINNIFKINRKKAPILLICVFPCKNTTRLFLHFRQFFLMFLSFSFLPHFDSGDTDAVIPVTSTRYSIDALKLPTVRPWRAWYDDGQVNCFRNCIIFHNLSFLLVI